MCSQKPLRWGPSVRGKTRLPTPNVTEAVEDDGDPFEEKMPRLVAELHAQFTESGKLEEAIKANLRGLGYGG